MIPRGRLDLSALDIAAAAAACLATSRRTDLERQIEDLWSFEGDALVCLSVRSGLDLLLNALAYAPGTEILVSAVTIRDMVRILGQHGLVPVPVDLDMGRLTVGVDSLHRSLTPRTKAVLVAHLFGSRMPLGELAAFCRERGLLLLEDCAQSFTADGYHGDAGADVSFFSFGPIKTSTALGGAMVRIRDRALLDRMHALQSAWPAQRRTAFFERVLRFALVRLAMSRPAFTLLCAACRVLGRNHDDVVSHSVRGFSGPDFFSNIRRQPSVPLLAMLRRRIRRGHVDRARIERRVAAAREMIAALPGVPRPGQAAAFHSHWTFPVLAADPDALVRHLLRHGFDATRGSWSLYPVPAPEGSSHPRAAAAHEAMAHVVYLPVYPEVPRRDRARLAKAVLSFPERIPVERLVEAAGARARG
jgi:perosamine synthetase